MANLFVYPSGTIVHVLDDGRRFLVNTYPAPDGSVRIGLGGRPEEQHRVLKGKETPAPPAQ